MYIYNRYVTRVVGACGVGSVLTVLACLAGLVFAATTVGAGWGAIILGCMGAPTVEIAACTAAIALEACS